MLKLFTKTALEIALAEEMSEHLGYDKHAVADPETGNSRNGTRTKTVLTDNAGPVDIEVPRDRDASFEPIIVRKRQHRLGDVDTVVLSLYANGLTTGEISAHFAEVYGASLSKDRIARDHRPSHRGDERVVQPPAAAGVRGDLHRRDRSAWSVTVPNPRFAP